MRRCVPALLLLLPARAIAVEYGSDDFVKSRFPLPGAIRTVKAMQAGAAYGPGEKIPPSAIECTGKSVFPATPGQRTKAYHADLLLFYDEGRVPGTREIGPAPEAASLPGNYIQPQSLCRIPAKSGSLNPRTGDRWCQLAKVGRYTMMSDLFFCRVGDDVRFYRGYWESAAIYQSFNSANPMITFRTENEHLMTTSLGRGDTMTTDAQGTNDFVPGPTFDEARSRFLFFTKATEQDILKIDDVLLRTAGPAGTYQRCADGTFVARKAGKCEP
jgi:hypothetical protein